MSIIGIDLGTTNSLASVFQGGRSVLIPNAAGGVMTPSAVAVEEDGGIIVGEAAKHRMLTAPECCAISFKRFMGTKKKVTLAGQSFCAEELSAFILRSLKRDAERFLGETVEEAIISVPAYFGDAQRRATKHAGELAGFRVERLVNEPSAAALSYALRQDGELRDLLVFDFGGGTLDVSVLEAFDNVIEIRAVAGDNHLGGDDFDQLIVEHFIKQTGIDSLTLDRSALACLLVAARNCKCMLTDNDTAIMKIYIKDTDYKLEITNQEFLGICSPLFSRIDKVLRRALDDSGKTFDSLDDLIIVGGSSRMPIIKSFLKKLSGKMPLCDFNPDEIVALGAGMAAGMKGRDVCLREILLSDVCPFSLGIGMTGDRYSPIIERNSILPVSQMKRYFTIHDEQDSIYCEIYQGERRTASENYKLGELSMPVPIAPAGEAAIDIRFTYDINGILEVEAYAVGSGERKRVLILSESGMSEKEAENVLKNMERLKFHPRDRKENQELIRQGERLYAENLGEKREQISELLTYFETALDMQDESEIRQRFIKVFAAFMTLEKPVFYVGNDDGGKENGRKG